MSLAGRIADQIRWLRRSSTLRLSLILSGVFVVVMAGAIFAALVIGENMLERRVDRTLVALAQTATLDDSRDDTFSLVLRARNDLEGLPPAFRQVARRGGGTVELEREFRRAETWRGLVAEDSRGIPVFVAVPLDDSEETLELLAETLWTTVLVVAALAVTIGLGAGLLARRRLAKIDTTLERLAGGDLTARTGHTRSKDDLDDIARQLDVTAGELERLVAQTRHLSASLAHDLRTPLARLRARLEMLPEGEARGAALEEASRLSDIFDTIMRVARIEAAQGQDGFEPVDLGVLAEELAEVFGPVIEDAEAVLALEVSAPATVNADRPMLIQAMANLIQNAIVHGDDQITVFAQGHRIGVADNGPGVDPEHFSEIVKPMVRLDAARSTDGTGLGLALVRAVADRHSAGLDLEVNQPHGLRVSLSFAKL